MVPLCAKETYGHASSVIFLPLKIPVMKIIFTILILVHGLIHLMGFMQAFQFIEFKELTMQVAKPAGLVWLTAFLLLIATGALFVTGSKFWWLAGIAAVVVSQVIIIAFWQDAKFGTIPNILILAGCIIGFGYFSFNRSLQEDINSVLAQKSRQEQILDENMITGLPSPVRKWLRQSGAIDTNIPEIIRIDQTYQLQMDPDQKHWHNARAEQYFSTGVPAFVWNLEMKMRGVIDVVGKDRFLDGKGSMLIKLLALIPVVHEKDNPKINQGTLQRFLGEIVWFPHAAALPYIQWKEIDDQSARATLNYKGTTGTGTFYFDENGDVQRFTAMRYMGSGEDARLREWVIEVKEHQTMAGVRIPSLCEATWRMDDRDWTWAILEVTDLEYH